jgi:hypothetical protein
MVNMCISVGTRSGSAAEGHNRCKIDLASLKMLSGRGGSFVKPSEKPKDCPYCAESWPHSRSFHRCAELTCVFQFHLSYSLDVRFLAFIIPKDFLLTFNVVEKPIAMINDCPARLSGPLTVFIRIELINLGMTASTSSISCERDRRPRIDSLGALGEGRLAV